VGEGVDQLQNQNNQITGLPVGNKKRKNNNKKASTTSSQSAEKIASDPNNIANDETNGVNSTSTGSNVESNAANNAILTSGGKSEPPLTPNNIAAAANSENSKSVPGSKQEPIVSAGANHNLGAAGAGSLTNTGNLQIGAGGVPSGSVGPAGSVPLGKAQLGTSAVLSGSAGAAQIGRAGVTDRKNIRAVKKEILISLSKSAALASGQTQISNDVTPKPPTNSTLLNGTVAGPSADAVLVPQENATIIAEATTEDLASVVEEEVEVTTTSTTTTTPEPDTTPMEEPIYDDLTFNETVELKSKNITAHLFCNNILQANVTNSSVPCEQYILSSATETVIKIFYSNHCFMVKSCRPSE